LDNINKKPYTIRILPNKIAYTLKRSSKVLINIFNLHGRLLETLENSTKNAGNYTLKWNRNNYSSGIYYIKFSINDNAIVKKAVVIK